ncbi:MAG: sensor domain-containing diguanylate cyclase [Rhodocyclaceae bacterium]|nr:sensor domain-containing diguanylate cyclase [Rhodocyclaceae bacterium]
MLDSTAAARHRHLAWAGGSGVVLASVAALTVPVMSEPWTVRPWFEAMYLAGVVLLDGEIALFLALHVVAGVSASTRALAWLGGAYAFAAVASMAVFFTFPGLVERPLTPTPSEELAARWLWVLWHAGFPCFVLLALEARAKAEGRPRTNAAAERFADLFPLALGLALAAAAATAILHYADALPMVMGDGDGYQLAGSFMAGAVVALNVLTLLAVVYMTRLRELLYLWLALAMLAFTLDVLLSLAGSARYTAGWYVGHGLSLASAAAVMTALLIENFRLHRDAEIRAAFHEQEAMHDPLTGLFNRRYLMDKLSEELGRGRRYRYPVSVLMVDAVHFKRINDQNGHGVGDECLRALARTLGGRVHRFGDYAVRYGGEEFVVVLPECGLEGAADVAEEIRQRVEALHGRGAAPRPLTVSIGVATARSSAAQSVEALLAAADECLYRAKQQGRNRVVSPQESDAPRGLQPHPV